MSPLQRKWIAASSSAQTKVANPLSLEATYVTEAFFQSLALQEKTGFPFERERVCVWPSRESCGAACEPFAPTITPVRGSRQ